MAPGVAVNAEEALETAILAVLAEDAEVAGLLGDPLRLLGAGPKPAFPYLEVVRHQSVDASAADVDASEHRIDLAVTSRDGGGARVKAAIAAVRAALANAELAMTGWRCVLLVPVFSDAARSDIEIWRGLLRLRALVEAV
ncbi:MAG TPA: DUF3168 domain-containing protein [Hyphomonadaceae bacterium]|nr:DUF3168 domain-containing protein [Hyphomonadaceae bacterium]